MLGGAAAAHANENEGGGGGFWTFCDPYTDFFLDHSPRIDHSSNFSFLKEKKKIENIF